MIDRTVSVIKVNDHEAVAVMRVRDILETAIPARSFLPNARLGPIEQREVDRLRHLHALIQRDFTGAKKSNAQGPLADYIRKDWLPEKVGTPTVGFLPAFVMYFPRGLDIDDDDRTAHISSMGIFLDGESRGESLLVNIEKLSETEVDKLLSKQVAVHIVHGIDNPKAIAKYFADVNGKGVGVNPNLVVMADYTDPYAEITKRVFEQLDLELETRQRQVRAKSNAVMTGLQARLMIAAIAKGVGAVQFGAKPIPQEHVDFDKLEEVAGTWLKRVFKRFGIPSFRDKAMILRAVPVVASLGALGQPFYTGDSAELTQKKALEILSDKRIDWRIGGHWVGISGKVNPETKVFSVGGGKEYAYLTWRAVKEPKSAGGRQIRHLEEEVAAA